MAHHKKGPGSLQINGVGQAAGQQLGALLGDDLFADDVAHRAVDTRGAGVDVGFEAALVIGQLALDGGLIEVLQPALGLVDAGALLRCAQECIGVQRDRGLEVHGGAVAVLLEAGVQGHPGVERGVGVDVLGGFGCGGAADPVLQLLGADFDGAELVARGYLDWVAEPVVVR